MDNYHLFKIKMNRAEKHFCEINNITYNMYCCSIYSKHFGMKSTKKIKTIEFIKPINLEENLLFINTLKELKKKYKLNYIIDPKLKFKEIPLPYRDRLFLPCRRKNDDPFSFRKINETKIMVLFPLFSSAL